MTPQPEPRVVRAFIKGVRIRSGMSQADVAALSGVTQGSISKFEDETRKDFNFGTFVRYCNALSISPVVACYAALSLSATKELNDATVVALEAERDSIK